MTANLGLRLLYVISYYLQVFQFWTTGNAVIAANFVVSFVLFFVRN